VHRPVSDEGRGFDPESLTPGRVGGFGLTSMRERAQAFGGAFEVRSRPGGGTQVDVAL
jgi:signal transduction histidine kinase